MRKLLAIILAALLTLAIIDDCNAQMTVAGDTLEITGGGSFGAGIKLINAVTTDSILTTVIDSDSALVTSGAVFDFGGAGFTGIDAANISSVKFIQLDGTFVYESFAHIHNEYALATSLSSFTDNYVLIGTGTGIEATAALQFDGEILTINSSLLDNSDADTLDIIEDNVKITADNVWFDGTTGTIGTDVDYNVQPNGRGVINVTGTTDYEDNVDDDDDIPNKKYVDDAIANNILELKVALSSGDVNTLGTAPVELLPVGGAGIVYQILGFTWSMTKTTQLEVGTQTLIVTAAASSDPIFSIGNALVESNSSIIAQPSLEDEGTLKANTAIDMWFSGGANPSSGDVTMDVYITYIKKTL